MLRNGECCMEGVHHSAACHREEGAQGASVHRLHKGLLMVRVRLGRGRRWVGGLRMRGMHLCVGGSEP